MGFDEATWTAVAAVLTALGAAWTVYAWKYRGVASGIRGAGLTLLPVAAWATGSLRMFSEILGSILDWATGLVFSPLVWAGVSIFGLSIVLLVVAGFMRSRGAGGRPERSGDDQRRPGEARSAGRREELQASSGPEQGPVVDDDMADIEELLRRRGIT